MSSAQQSTLAQLACACKAQHEGMLELTASLRQEVYKTGTSSISKKLDDVTRHVVVHLARELNIL